MKTGLTRRRKSGGHVQIIWGTSRGHSIRRRLNGLTKDEIHLILLRLSPLDVVVLMIRWGSRKCKKVQALSKGCKNTEQK